MIPHWTYPTGKVVTYADVQNTPVPLVRYRCKSALKTTAHVCKLGVDHAGEHRCICGKIWHSSAVPA